MSSSTGRLGSTAAIGVLFSHGFARFLRSKRFIVALALCGFPAIVTALILYFGEIYEIDQLEERLRDQGWSAYLQVVVPVMALLACTPAIGDEIDEGTIGYLITRPVSRVAIFVGRFAAAVSWTVIFLVTGALAIVLSAGVPLSDLTEAFADAPDGDPGRAGLALLAVSAVGGFVYGAIFVSLGAIIRRSMIVGIAYVFAIEGFLSALPGKARTLTMQFHLREALRSIGPGFWSSGSKDIPDSEIQLLGVALVLACVAATALALGALTLKRRAFVRAD